MLLNELLKIEETYLSKTNFLKLGHDWFYEKEENGFIIAKKGLIGGISVEVKKSFDITSLVISRLYFEKKEEWESISNDYTKRNLHYRGYDFSSSFEINISDIHIGLDNLLKEVFGH